ncbi:collagen-binding domain-containing protein [Iodobacter fluviatilis]|uniref:Choice-of-anchor A domain n=1 Tax=Iodobacter fluviatilis TaxID=537 RepID=A0A377SVR1_9NEIS|nr:collagen-binding domain-containing protein [Iodobacter fluviatilis]TCU87917.1 putative secreted protein with PEP-CTERM sorting signal/choice-of-anchor A domain-containing protein [Iodobacter fluviatilis]STR45418.1 choice-of-anchor A domain [Iodobacter fluviatilis]
MRVTHIIAALGITLSAYAQAGIVDFGVANGYSGFFFGNVNAASDIEGRLAVGGNLTSGFDIGYRNPYGSTAPSLVVQGNVSLTGPWGKVGSVYNGPKTNIDTNTSIGPSSIDLSSLNKGNLVYGGSLAAVNWQYGVAVKNASFLDFAAAKTQLSGLSSFLSGQAQLGSWTNSGGGLVLTGDGQSDVQVFNLGNTALQNISLKNVKAGANIIINSTLSDVVFSGDFGGNLAGSKDPLALHRDRIIYNLSNAKSVNVSTFLNGSVLAVNADVVGSGHLEGTLIANSLSAGANGKLELGYEPYKGSALPVPEPETYALMGLGLVGLVMRRRSKK